MKKIQTYIELAAFCKIPMVAGFCLISLLTPLANANSSSCSALFANGKIESPPQPTQREQKADADLLVISTVPNGADLPEAERLLRESELAKRELRKSYLEKKVFLDNVRETLKKSFTGYDEFIDDIMRLPERIHLGKPFDPKNPTAKPALVVHLHGPAGIGKSAIIIRYAQLLGAADRTIVEKIKKDTVEFPTESLQQLADQRFRHLDRGVSIFVADEIFDLKDKKDLVEDKKVPIENDTKGTESGEPRMKIINEVKLRADSLEVFEAATGSGDVTRTPKKSPSTYINELTDISSKILEAKSQIQMSRDKITHATEDKSFNAESEKNNIQSQENTIRYSSRSVIDLFGQMKRDQPDFFSREGYADVMKMKPELGNIIGADIEDMTPGHLNLLWKKYPEEVEDYLTLRSGKMPEKPLETYYDTLIVLSGNPVKSIEKVESSFRGRKPTPDELVAQYKRLIPDSEVEEALLAKFGDGPAIRSRLRSNGITMRLPPDMEGYRKLIRRAINTHEHDFEVTLGAMGVEGVQLKIDPSIFKVIEEEAVHAMMGPREFFPRMDSILESVNYRARSKIAELAETIKTLEERGLTSPVHLPSLVTISFDPGTRLIQLRSNGSPDPIEQDFYLSKFREVPTEPEMVQFDRQMRSIFLASSAVAGMVLHHSYPKTLNMMMRQMTLDDMWVSPKAKNYGAKQAHIAVMLAGMVGEQVSAKGAFISEWSKDGQTLAMRVMNEMLTDLQYRERDLPNLLSAVKEADPKKQLSRGFAAAISKAEYKNVPEFLHVMTKTVRSILAKNYELVKAIAVQIEAHESITPEELKVILDDYSKKTRAGKIFVENLRLALGPSGTQRLARSKNILEEEAGKIYVPDIGMFAEARGKVSTIGKLRKMIYGDATNYWKP